MIACFQNAITFAFFKQFLEMIIRLTTAILLSVSCLLTNAQQKVPLKLMNSLGIRSAQKEGNFRKSPQWQQVLMSSQRPANKRSAFLLDSIETYTFENGDSTLTEFRFFGYNNQDRLTDDAEYLVEDDGDREGLERTTYEFGTGLYAEITHSWDIVNRDWEPVSKTEYRANLGRNDTIFMVLEYNWNPGTSKWDGFEGEAFLKQKRSGW